MKILLLGLGLQGKAALFDLLHSPEVDHITVGEINLEGASTASAASDGQKVSYQHLDASDLINVSSLMEGMDAVINLLPAAFRNPITKTAIQQRCHYVDASYATPEMEALHQMALDHGVTVLPEFGLDPGIDLVLTTEAVKTLDKVTGLYSYGAGIPERSASGNPLRYKISWSFTGVLNAYTRPARIVTGGVPINIPGDRLFEPENVHHVHVEGLGELEAYPNGDALKYVKLLGLDASILEAGRYSMRWPGHSETWRMIAGLGLLGDRPVDVRGTAVVPREYLHDLLYPQLQYGPDERDIAIIRVVVEGLRAGRRKRVTCQVLDSRDLESGLLAMQRTVGFTASIGARMIASGEIKKRGLLSPLYDVPAGLLLERLAERGVVVFREETDID